MHVLDVVDVVGDLVVGALTHLALKHLAAVRHLREVIAILASNFMHGQSLLRNVQVAVAAGFPIERDNFIVLGIHMVVIISGLAEHLDAKLALKR